MDYNEIAKVVEETVERLLTKHLENFIHSDSSWKESDMNQKVRYRITLPNGKETWAIGNTQKEAFEDGQRKCAEVLSQEKDSKTLEEFFDTVYWPLFTESLAPTTKENYHIYWSRYIQPFFGNCPLNSITIGT